MPHQPFQFTSQSHSRNPISDWTLRIGVAAFYLIFGLEKFSAREPHWVTLFREIGFGDWFRYLTGVVEVLGALFVLIPKTVIFGLSLLCSTMGAAVLLLAFRLHRPGDAVFPAIFLLVLAGLAWARRRFN